MQESWPPRSWTPLLQPLQTCWGVPLARNTGVNPLLFGWSPCVSIGRRQKVDTHQKRTCERDRKPGWAGRATSPIQPAPSDPAAFVWGLGRGGAREECRQEAFKARAQRHVKLLNDTKLWASLDLGGRKNKFLLVMAPRGQANYGNRHMEEFLFSLGSCKRGRKKNLGNKVKMARQMSASKQ